MLDVKDAAHSLQHFTAERNNVNSYNKAHSGKEMGFVYKRDMVKA